MNQLKVIMLFRLSRYLILQLHLQEKAYSTGYALRKGGSFYQNQCGNGQSYTGSITFRAVEALLNYIEASYEKNGTIDAKS